MRTMNKSSFFVLIVASLTLFLSGCSAGEPSLVGIWQVNESSISGRNLSDGKSFFHFKEDGTVYTRSAPGFFRDGTYKEDKEKKTISLESGGSTNTYTYQLTETELVMDAPMPGGGNLHIVAVPTDQLPVTEEEEAHLKDLPAPIPTSVDTSAADPDTASE